ncbi:MAG: hypothetical protein DMG65_04375 [Candidatus Angelobacter sp. Gp1-AA117]|nr:MAG: hypothetical protein DMG65_04375 [Candidatus Angelobacter sp. Gp1-AA117]
MQLVSKYHLLKGKAISIVTDEVSMAKFYDVPIRWRDKTSDVGRGIGNNVASKCRCKAVLLGPHGDLYSIPPCPSCGREFKIMRGKKPQFVARGEVIKNAAPPALGV